MKPEPFFYIKNSDMDFFSSLYDNNFQKLMVML